MTKRDRLDAELVRRGLARSRAEAKALIDEGEVTIKGLPTPQPSSLVDAQTHIALADRPARYVSRGGDKLDRALVRLGVPVARRRWLDVGASTGGFTDRLLQAGASAVIALDVGYGQLDWKLRNDERVVVLERVNARTLKPEDLPWRPDAAVADVSFISLTLVLPAVVEACAAGADFVVLVKPQFESQRPDVGKGGVVRDRGVWESAMTRVATKAFELGLGLVDAVASELPGPAGNREFFLHLRAGATTQLEPIGRAVRELAAPAP